MSQYKITLDSRCTNGIPQRIIQADGMETTDDGTGLYFVRDSVRVAGFNKKFVVSVELMPNEPR